MGLAEVREEEIIEDKIDREEDMVIKEEEVKVEEEEAVMIIGGAVKDMMDREAMKMIKIKMLNQMIIGDKMNRMLKKKKVMIKIEMTVKPIIMIMINLINKTLIKNMTEEIVKIEGVKEKMGYKKGIVINKKPNLIQIQILGCIM
jgi:hypothetical protein